jgi:Rho termination factor, N-terminal domain
MTKAELESKHLAELHTLAAKADVPRYRMLRREELIEKLSGEKPAQAGRPERQEKRERPQRDRPPRQRRERPARQAAPADEPTAAEPAAQPAPPAAAPPAAADDGASARPRRRRRRRRFGRKSKGLRVHDLLLPPRSRQALVYGESRAACTALLREIAGELAGAESGPDPIALLVDPSPEELADWKREAPRAEIVAAGQARHASDALAQAVRRAEGGEDVILLVDSLTRFVESFEDADAAKDIFDGAPTQAKGSLTVVAALERPA